MNNKSEDRGMMKWAAFHSVISEDEINTYINKNTKNIKPEFSEDQIMELENLIVEAYNSNSMVTLTIFGKYRNSFVTGIITKLDSINKLVFVDKKPYKFDDILNIKYN